MRNLKRVLSLSLASIMLLGMMVIGASAAQDYSDVDYVNDNVEAIEVLDAINVMRGDLDANGELAGTFRPGSDVKRSEMARIMAYLMDLDYDYYIGVNPFSDMVGHWAEGFAAACAANGIIYGRTTTTYDPDATVTAVEAAAMLMRGLGYFQNPEVDQPNGFEIDTIRQAGRINLFNKVDAKTNEPMTRNDVAQLVLNALQSGMVEPSNNRVEVTVGDAQVAIGSSNYVYTVARDNTVGKAINATTATAGNSSTGLEGYILDLGEHLYQGELRLNNDAQDVYGRPARTWEFGGQTIGTYYKTELLADEYYLAVSGKTIYDLLGSSIVEGSNQYDFRIYMDGLKYEENPAFFEKPDINRNNNDTLDGTGRGVLTQVFVDNSKENIYDRGEVTITMINTYLAIATADYNASRDQASFDVYYLNKVNGDLIKNNSTITLTTTSEDFSIAADVLEDEVYLVTVAEGEIQSLVPAPAIEETAIDAFTRNKYVEIDGAKYNFAETTRYDVDTLKDYTGNSATPNLKEARYNVFLDLYDNLIGVVEIDPVKNYVFITGVDSDYSHLAATNFKANGIFLDGSMATITVDSKKSKASFINYINYNGPGTDEDYDIMTGDGVNGNKRAVVNTWCTYTVSSAGVYALDRVNYAPEFTSTKGIGGSPALGKTTMDKRAQYHDVLATEIDYRNYSLEGDTSGIYNRVYTNDNTVFLTASVKAVKTEDGDVDPDILIHEVAGVAVGIDNVKIDVYNDPDLAEENAEGRDGTGDYRYASHGSYVLYDKDGDVIAVLAVGNDGGVGSDFVYVHSGDIEERDLEDELRQWTRKVLLGGEEVTLYEINDTGISQLDDMVNRSWYRVTYKADGTVRDVKSFAPTDGSGWNNYAGNVAGGDISNWGTTVTSLPSGTAATTDIREIATLIKSNGDGRDVVVYDQVITNARPGMDKNNSRTMHVLDTNYSDPKGDGIRVTEDVSVWVNREVKNKRSWTSGTGPSYLRTVLDNLTETSTGSGTYSYQIAALIEQGAATMIVIYDNLSDYERPAGSDIIGTYADSGWNIEDINAALKNGDVTVAEGWTPNTTNPPHEDTLKIPVGRTLKFLGDLNLTGTKYGAYDGTTYDPASKDTTIGVSTEGTKTGDKVAKLIVEGRLLIDKAVSGGTIDYDIEAGSMVFRSTVGNNFAINSKVTITGDGEDYNDKHLADLYLADNVVLTVSKDGRLEITDEEAEGAQFACGKNGKLVINGHVRIDGVLQVAPEINSWNTLVATEPVEADVTIGDDGKDYGRFDGTVDDGYKVELGTISRAVRESKPFDVASKLDLSNGAVFVANVDEMVIQNVPKGVTLIIDADDVLIGGSIGTKDIVVNQGKSLVLAKGTKIVDEAKEIFTTKTGAVITEVGDEDLIVLEEVAAATATSPDAKEAAGGLKTGDITVSDDNVSEGGLGIDSDSVEAGLPFVLKTVSQSELKKVSKDAHGTEKPLNASDLTFVSFDADKMKVVVKTAFEIEEYDADESPWFNGAALASDNEEGTYGPYVYFGGDSRLGGEKEVKYAIVLNLYSKDLAGKSFLRFKDDRWDTGAWVEYDWPDDGNNYIVIGKNGDETTTEWEFALVGEAGTSDTHGKDTVPAESRLKITVDWTRMTTETSVDSGT